MFTYITYPILSFFKLLFSFLKLYAIGKKVHSSMPLKKLIQSSIRKTRLHRSLSYYFDIFLSRIMFFEISCNSQPGLKSAFLCTPCNWLFNEVKKILPQVDEGGKDELEAAIKVSMFSP